MEIPPYSMANELSHDTESVLFDGVLYRRTDSAEAAAFSRLFDAGIQRIFRNLQQSLHFFGNFADRDGSSSISNEAVKNYPDIQFNDVAVLYPAMATDPVNDLVVERNTNISGKLFISKECATATGIRH